MPGHRQKMEVRTRFAPSPTGDPHIGSVWIALFNWLYAKHHKGKFILRIEDTDQARLIAGTENKIIEALRWLGIDYDEGPDIDGPYGPYRQSERLGLYREYAQYLIKSNTAYYCFCSAERLKELRGWQEKNKKPTGYDGLCRQLNAPESFKRAHSGESSVIRLKMPTVGKTTVTDLIRGAIIFKNELIDDQVLIKTDGWPTYHLASVVDDHLMKINPVIRAEEWLPSTPKALILYQALGWTPPQFAHLPLILGTDRSKLSKRQGSTDILKFREEGYLAEALINFLALLGWSPKSANEFYNRKNLISKFDLKAVNKSGAIFDIHKLDWFNSHYLKSLPEREAIRLITPHLEQRGALSLPKNKLIKISKLAFERAKKLTDVPMLIDFLFDQPQYEASLLHWEKTNSKNTSARLSHVLLVLKNLKESSFREQKLEKIIKSEIKSYNLGVGDTLWPLRVALTGMKDSPGPFIVAEILGKKETLARLDSALKKLT